VSELPREKLPLPTNVSNVFLAMSHAFAFPILDLKITSSDLSDNIVEVKVSPKIYELIKNTQQIDEFPIVLPVNSPMTFWTYDLTIATNILSSLGIMSDKKKWITNSQKKIVDLLDNKKTSMKNPNARALEISEEILQELKLLDEIRDNALISITTMDLAERGEMDSDTIIYKVALAIYHSKNMAGKSLIPEVDDDAGLYLKFAQSELKDKYAKEFSPMMVLPLEAQTKTIKILVCLIISAYGYYKASIED